MVLDSVKDIEKWWKIQHLRVFQGKMLDDSDVLIVVQKTSLEISKKDILELKDDDFEKITKNPPYTSLFNEKMHLIIINPCDKHHINKYSSISYKQESYEEHLNHLKTEKLSTKWIRFILNNETEEILRQNDEFFLITSYKWNKKSTHDLYLLLFVKNDKIFTLREMSLEMAERAKEFILKSVIELYGIEKQHLVLFFHYRPSYYHCHIHIINIIGNINLSMVVGRAILLDDVIENLKIDPLYYKKRTMFYIESDQ